MNKLFLNRFYYTLMVIISCEIVLGGLGNLMGFPIRKILLVLGIVFSIVVMYKEKIKIPKNYLMWIGLFILYVGIGVLTGLWNGNSLGDIISDGNVFLGIVYLLFLICLIKDDIHCLNKLSQVIINCSVIVAVITILLFLYSGLFLPEDVSIIDTYMNLNNKLNYGLITGLVYSGRFARIYLFNGIYMQIAVALLIIKVIQKKSFKNKETFKLVILGLGIFLSSTRGFWLGLIVVGTLYILYFFRYKIGKTFKYLKGSRYLKKIIITFMASLLLTIIGGALSINHLVSEMNQETTIELIKGEEYNQNSGSESFVSRVFSIFDFKKNLSNKIRLVQAQFLAERIVEKPLLGWGFGARIEEYKQYMADSDMPPVDSSSFELYYVELIFKTGVIGFGVIISYFIYRMIILFRILMKIKIQLIGQELLVGWTIAFISLVVASFTNPYLGSLTGFFSLVTFIYVMEMFIIKYSSNEN